MDSMQGMGVTVDRPVYPTSLELSKNEAELKDPNSHPIKVHFSPICALLNQLLYVMYQVALLRDGSTDTEIVRAKFVVGADGTYPTN